MIMRGMGDESPPKSKLNANVGKTNRFAPFQITEPSRLLGHASALASGMAARREDPLSGLQRSQQPGPQGDAQFPTRKFQDDIGAMIASRTSFGLNTANDGAPTSIDEARASCWQIYPGQTADLVAALADPDGCTLRE